MSTAINKAQIGAIATMCAYANIGKEAKAVMVEGFSGGRCSSSKDLFYDEATAMLTHLATLQPEDPQITKMQGKIFYYAHLMHWTKQNTKGKIVVDGRRIDEWMEQYSYLKKKLNRYTKKELPKLVSQFALVYKKFLNSI